MKQRYIPLGKRSKREQKAYHASLRGNWGAINPVTRKAPNPKAYNRNKSGQRYEHEPLPGLFCFAATNTSRHSRAVISDTAGVFANLLA